jgi:hypothetical protein
MLKMLEREREREFRRNGLFRYTCVATNSYGEAHSSAVLSCANIVPHSPNTRHENSFNTIGYIESQKVIAAILIDRIQLQ